LFGSSLLGLALRFKAHAVNCRIDFGNTDDLGDAVPPIGARSRKSIGFTVRSFVPGQVVPECSLNNNYRSSSNWHEAAQASPTGPAPATYTVDPVVVTPAFTAPS